MNRLLADHTLPVLRRSGNYKPCIHRHNNLVQSLTTEYKVLPFISSSFFLSFSCNAQFFKQIERFKGRVDKLREDVVEMFNDVSEPLDQLELIDDLQRLGVAYYFDGEIKSTLEKIFEDQNNNHWEIKDLHATALKFRLLRQHGYAVSEGK